MEYAQAHMLSALMVVIAVVVLSVVYGLYGRQREMRA